MPFRDRPRIIATTDKFLGMTREAITGRARYFFEMTLHPPTHLTPSHIPRCRARRATSSRHPHRPSRFTPASLQPLGGDLLGEYTPTSQSTPIREYVWLGDIPVAVLTHNAYVLDNAGTGVSLVGTWPLTQNVNGYGFSYLSHAAGTGTNSVTWTPALASGGSYRIYARWTDGADRAGNATYQITHTGGSSNVTVNQQQQGGQWNLLGTFTLTPGAGHNVRLTDNANGTVVADAVKFVPANAGTVYSIQTDHLNTPRIVKSSTGTIVWRWDSDPFGATPPNQDADGDGIVFEFPLRFAGQYWDKETNTFYNYFRDCYDPGTGRFCQPDPIGLAGGSLSIYTYANQNPLSNIDPLGLAIVDPNSRTGAGGGGGAEGLVIAGAALVNAIMNSSRQSTPASSPTSEQSEPNRSIWPPERQPGLWSCKARADCNDNIPGNCPDDPKHRFAFGGGSASDLGTARNIAKANATSNLQCQPKHVSCKCTGPKGEQYSGGC